MQFLQIVSENHQDVHISGHDPWELCTNHTWVWTNCKFSPSVKQLHKAYFTTWHYFAYILYITMTSYPQILYKANASLYFLRLSPRDGRNLGKLPVFSFQKLATKAPEDSIFIYSSCVKKLCKRYIKVVNQRPASFLTHGGKAHLLFTTISRTHFEQQNLWGWFAMLTCSF